MVFVALIIYFLLSMQVQPVLGFPWDWTKDPLMEGILEDGCDFPIFDMANQETAVDRSLLFPYIARNMDLNWSAFRKWEKEAFLSHYGSNFVRSGSEASIVHSGGVAENETTLSAMINSMSHSKSQVYGDSFLFDTTILKAIPELTKDFDVPTIFQAWDTPENESTGALWHMMSLGPSRSGKLCATASINSVYDSYLISCYAVRRFAIPRSRQDLAYCGAWHQAMVCLSSWL